MGKGSESGRRSGRVFSSYIFRQFRKTISFRVISIGYILFHFVKMTVSRNMKFRKIGFLFIKIRKLVSLPFRKNFAKRNFAGNPTCTYTLHKAHDPHMRTSEHTPLSTLYEPQSTTPQQRKAIDLRKKSNTCRQSHGKSV
jgi:hypothetical protein